MLQRLLIVGVGVFGATAANFQREFTLTSRYPDSTCTATPTFILVQEATDCEEIKCADGTKLSTVCSSGSTYLANVQTLFNQVPYVIRETYGGRNCSDFQSAQVFNAVGDCVEDTASEMFTIAKVDVTGSVSMQYFLEATCASASLHHVDSISGNTVQEHSCTSNSEKWYTNSGNDRALAWIVIATDELNSTDTSTDAAGAASSTTGIDDTSLTFSEDATAPTTDDTSTDPLTTSADATAETAPITTEEPPVVSGDASTTGSSKAMVSSTGSSSSSGGSAQTDTDTDSSFAVDSPVSSSTSIDTDDTGSSSSGASTSSTRSSPGTRKSSRVKIATAAPELDVVSSSSSSSGFSDSGSGGTGSIQDNIATDTSASGSMKSVATAKSGISAVAIVAVVMGSLVIGLVVIGSIVRRRTRDDDDIQSPLPTASCRRTSGPYWGQTSPINRQRRSQQRFSEQRYTDSLASRPGSMQRASSGQTGLWNDDIITARRISLDNVQVQEIISRGAFGEVYMGYYNHKPVAVKMLLPQMRGDINQVNQLLTEAKITATMEHPHIVSFVGVAWDSLSDVCVVLEYMDGGDLRSLLNKYETTRHPVGFNREKVTIALHVCHALAYMHSLAPPVIHRDLKSRNILLNQAMVAKLTDFGISRERLDRTMTAGVGTSLWMAPEVMMGKRYDDKADIFSFGVVLSELDTHSLPYAKAKAANPTQGQMACAVMLQKVALGTLRVEFSPAALRSMAQLGNACVSLNPSERPTAAAMLYTLQTILNRELA